jgi:hypothetical protein
VTLFSALQVVRVAVTTVDMAVIAASMQLAPVETLCMQCVRGRFHIRSWLR